MMLQRYVHVILTILSSLVLLAACSRAELPPVRNVPINYGTDPHILRGVWTGQNKDGLSLTLDLETRSPSAQGYFSVGTFKLGDASEVPFSAQVKIPLAVGPSVTAQQTGEPECEGNVTGQVDYTFGMETELFFDVCGTTPKGLPPEFHMTLTDRNGPTPVASDFVLIRQPDPPTPDYLVQGSIIQLRGEPNTYDGEFVFTENSHAIVQLWYSPSYFGDGPKELLTETTIEPIADFPIPFRLEGDPEEVFEREGDYYLLVGVFSGDGGPTGETFAVGDLINEVYTSVEKPGADVRVEVTGLEACGSDAGGACVRDLERNPITRYGGNRM